MVSPEGNPKLSESQIGADSTDDADYRMSDGGQGLGELSELGFMGFTDFQDYRTFLLENCPL